MIQKIKIVLDSFFGDCGKGNTVQWLCQQALDNGEKPIVVRFSGGPQSGHRVLLYGLQHVCSLVGSGVLLGIPTFLNKNVYINPISLRNEMQSLMDKGINPKVYIDYKCRVITPYDIIQDCGDFRVREHGTCGCGIHATFKRYLKHPSETFNITYALGFPEAYLSKVRTSSMGEIDESDFIDACKWLAARIKLKSEDFLNEWSTVIFEGSQGLLLDMDNGFMPHCTPSRVGLNGIHPNYLDNAEVYLVIRSYLTRHGNGYEPIGESIVRANYKNLEEPTNLDTGPQGKFKIGLLNLDLLRDSFVRHHLDNYARMHGVKYNLVITHMDCTKDDTLIVFNKNHQYVIHPGHIEFDIIDFENIYLGYGPNSLFKKCER